MNKQEALDLAYEHFAAVAKVDASASPEVAAARAEAIEFWKIVINALKRGKRDRK